MELISVCTLCNKPSIISGLQIRFSIEDFIFHFWIILDSVPWWLCKTCEFDSLLEPFIPSRDVGTDVVLSRAMTDVSNCQMLNYDPGRKSESFLIPVLIQKLIFLWWSSWMCCSSVWSMLLLSACTQVTSFFTGPNKAQTADVQTNSQTNGSSLSFKPRGRDFSFGKYYEN